MTSDEYRKIIRAISINAIKKSFPGLKRAQLEETATTIARGIHARMYGANVDGVDSPIWSIDQNTSERIEKALAAHPHGPKSKKEPELRFWTHKDGNRCKCIECLPKRREQYKSKFNNFMLRKQQKELANE